jgi:hypothetical protein
MNWPLFLKISSGLLIVPISITAHIIWPKWTKATVPVRIATGPVVLPIVGIAALTTSWWDSLK